MTKFISNKTVLQERASTAAKFAVLVLAFLLMFSAASAVPSYAAEDNSHVYIGTDGSNDDIIKMGFIVIDNYNYIDANGEWRGYDIELMLRMTQYGELAIDGIPFESSADALDALRNGDVNALVDFNRTEERAAEFLLTDNTVASDKLVVYARSDNNELTYGNMRQLDGVRIGTIDGSGVNELLPEECEKYDAKPVLVKFGSVEEINAALDAGSIDAACSGGNAAPKEYKEVASFMSDSAYILLRKDETKLCDKFDDIINKLLADDPFYMYNLSSKYQTQSAADSVSLTAEEEKFLESHGPITVALPKHDSPYVEEENGELTGIMPDYYNMLAEKLGTTVELKGYETSDEAADAVRNGEADILGLFYGDIITANNEELTITEPYIKYECTLFCTKGKEDNIKTVGATVRTEDIFRVQFAKLGMDIEVIPYDTVPECHEALHNGEVDAIACSVTTANWLLNQHSNARGTLIALPEVQMDMAGCVKESGLLYTIINKAIDISEADMSSIITEYSVTDTSNMRTVIENLPPMLVLIVSAVIIATLTALVISLLRLYRRNKERAILAEKEAETERREAQVNAEREFNKKRSAFFSNISHDMRTPLNAILGFSGLAQKTDDKEKVDEYLDKINLSGGVLLNLINDTLTVSKMNNGKLELLEEPADTEKLLKEVCVPIRAAAEKKKISFVENVPAENHVIRCDALNLEKVLMNILSNAVKYTPEGGTVKFDAEIAAAENQDTDEGSGKVSLNVKVSDNGQGMDKEFLPHIFEAFAQEDNRFGSSSGVGLGLSIVKELVDLMGGTIDVESEKGVGSTFTLSIPFDELDASETASAADEQGGEKDADLTGREILLCEDNDLNAEIACAIIGEYGANVTVAKDGAEGVAKFEDSPVDFYSLILMDLRMPEMDGYTAAAAIRALGRADAGTVPIVAMSADAFEDDVRRCMEIGMNGHIPKPIDMNKLLEVLRNL